MSLLNEETAAEPHRVVEYLTEVEEAAEDVLTTKQQVKSIVTRFMYLVLRRAR